MLNSIETMARLLQMSSRNRTLAWARLVCESGRDVYLDIWECSPGHSFVRRTVLKLYDKSIEAFRTMAKSTANASARRELLDFQRNAMFRRRDLAENYLNGKNPELATTETLRAIKEEAAKATVG
jgi:hypothetical protein